MRVRCVRDVGFVQIAMTVLKVVPLIAIIGLALFTGSGSNLPAFNPSGGSVFGVLSCIDYGDDIPVMEQLVDAAPEAGAVVDERVVAEKGAIVAMVRPDDGETLGMERARTRGSEKIDGQSHPVAHCQVL